MSKIYRSVYTSNSNSGNVLDRFIYELQQTSKCTFIVGLFTIAKNKIKTNPGKTITHFVNTHIDAMMVNSPKTEGEHGYKRLIPRLGWGAEFEGNTGRKGFCPNPDFWGMDIHRSLPSFQNE